MAKKEKSKKKKIFRLVILDNENLKEHYSLILSKFNIFTYGGTIFIIIALLTFALLIFTPLRFILPNQDNIKLQTLVAKNTMLIDSLEKEIAFRDNYFQKIQDILNQKNIEQFKADTSKSKIISQAEKDSIIKQLVAQQNALINQIKSDDTLDGNNIFIKPIEGTVSNEFNITKEHFGIDIIAKANDEVLSAISGKVIFSSWTKNDGYVIQIQNGNLITIYKYCSELIKKQGDEVEAGEPIAIVGYKSNKPNQPLLHFEIWEDGQPINPIKYLKY